jgi:hypothetical protein
MRILGAQRFEGEQLVRALQALGFGSSFSVSAPPG